MKAAAVKQRTVTEDEFALLCAWLLVIGRVKVEDARYLAILAMDDFANHPCVMCVDCSPDTVPGLLRVTQVVEHLRRPGRHRFALHSESLRVIT